MNFLLLYYYIYLFIFILYLCFINFIFIILYNNSIQLAECQHKITSINLQYNNRIPFYSVNGIEFPSWNYILLKDVHYLNGMLHDGNKITLN